jgi:hypothetical protein
MRELWRKHKAKIIISFLVVAVLSGAFCCGGNYPKSAGSETTAVSEAKTSDNEVSSDTALASEAEAAPSDDSTSNLNTDTPTSDKNASSGMMSDTKPEEDTSSPGKITDSTGNSESDGMEINPQTGKDQYKTDPVPSGKPVPVEPQNAAITDQKETCTLSVSCTTILDNLNLLEQDKWELVPEDGVIYAAKTVTFYEGESVFNVLQREMKKAGIQMEFKNTPMYNTAYIAGIDNLYEFDTGELSGWVYAVNGWFPNYGCSRYQLQEGDVIQWLYTCDMGKDIGGSNATGS